MWCGVAECGVSRNHGWTDGALSAHSHVERPAAQSPAALLHTLHGLALGSLHELLALLLHLRVQLRPRLLVLQRTQRQLRRRGVAIRGDTSRNDPGQFSMGCCNSSAAFHRVLQTPEKPVNVPAAHFQGSQGSGGLMRVIILQPSSKRVLQWRRGSMHFHDAHLVVYETE